MESRMIDVLEKRAEEVNKSAFVPAIIKDLLKSWMADRRDLENRLRALEERK